jgi:hypothetical protein
MAYDLKEKLKIFEQIEADLIDKIIEGLPKVKPFGALDYLEKVIRIHERAVMIEKIHRENAEAMSGGSVNTKVIRCDITMVAPREPGEPDD